MCVYCMESCANRKGSYIKSREEKGILYAENNANFNIA